jgi:cytoskeletal protein RodZ
MFIEKTSNENLQKLKIKRESLGLSLDDVFKKIRIRASYLQDIENSEFHLLPDPVYTKNFIKTYARFLGVDEEPILKDYDAYINARKEELIPTRETTPEEKPFFTSVVNNKNYWGILFVFIIVFVVWLILKQNSPVSEEINSPSKIKIPASEIREQNVNSSPNATSTENQPSTADSGPKVNEAEKVAPANVIVQPINVKVDGSIKKNAPLPLETKQVASSGAQKSNLFIIANQETWIRVKGGENPPVQVLLKPGGKFENNAETFNLDIGNAGGIKIQYKGKYVENIGKPGEVVHIKLPQ